MQEHDRLPLPDDLIVDADPVGIHPSHLVPRHGAAARGPRGAPILLAPRSNRQRALLLVRGRNLRTSEDWAGSWPRPESDSPRCAPKGRLGHRQAFTGLSKVTVVSEPFARRCSMMVGASPGSRVSGSLMLSGSPPATRRRALGCTCA